MTQIFDAIVHAPRSVGIGLIKLYRLFLSPWIGGQCRYLPTCSEYTEGAVRRFGLWPGFWIGLARFQRCGPLGASGYDPLPDRLPDSAAWYMPWRYGRWTGKHIDPKTRLDVLGGRNDCHTEKCPCGNIPPPAVRLRRCRSEFR